MSSGSLDREVGWPWIDDGMALVLSERVEGSCEQACGTNKDQRDHPRCALRNASSRGRTVSSSAWRPLA